MGWAGELLKALNEIENDPGLTRYQLNQAVDAKVRELIERYRGEPLKESKGYPLSGTVSKFNGDFHAS